MTRFGPVLGLALATLAACGCIAATEPERAKISQSQAPGELYEEGRLVFGSPSLLAGIPGEGPLTDLQIDAWLADPQNHEPLDVVLPWHLRDPDRQLAIPKDNPLTRAKIELGRQLFFDRRLSRGERFACADCHHPRRHFSMYLNRNGPLRDPLPAVNRVLGTAQFWDGRAASLEAQPAFPLENVHEMNLSQDECVARLTEIGGYRRQFERIFGRTDFDGVRQSLASFLRAVVSGPTPWDEDQRRLTDLSSSGDAELLSAAARRGAELFFSQQAGCSRCHAGPNFSDERFHNVGTGLDQSPAEPGRFAVTGQEQDRGAFKTPTLRNVAHTGPYFHDGRFTSLEEAVAWFAEGGAEDLVAGNELKPLDLAPSQRADLVEFLRALSSDPPPLATGRLP